jgi:hypothetical protein
MIAEWLEIRTKQEKNVYFQVLTNRRCLFNVWLGISYDFQETEIYQTCVVALTMTAQVYYS